MITNTEQIYYSVDYKYELKSWLEQTKFYGADPVIDMGQAYILGLSYTNQTLYDLKKSYNYGSFSGAIFEKDEENIYNAKVQVNYNGNLVDELNTTNGLFSFSNLNKDLTYELKFIDTTNKYNSKSINLQPELDSNQDSHIFLYDTVRTKGDTISVYFEIYALGTPQVTLERAPTSYLLTKISDTIYSVTGNNDNKDIDFDIRLDDYRTDGLKTVYQNVKQNSMSSVSFKFKNSLLDTSGVYSLSKIGNPVMSSDNISIDGKANSIQYVKNTNIDELGSDRFTIIFDIYFKGFKNASVVGNKYLLSAFGPESSSNQSSFQLILDTNMYLMLSFLNNTATRYASPIRTTAAQILPNNRYRIKIENNGYYLCYYINDVLIYAYNGVTPAINLTGNGNLLFGGNSFDANTDRETIYDLYEFSVYRKYNVQ